MYEPQVDDYVKWTTDLGMVHEGWVYWKGEPAPEKRGWRKPEHYITIEVGVKDMPEEQARTSLHKSICSLLYISWFSPHIRINHLSFLSFQECPLR